MDSNLIRERWREDQPRYESLIQYVCTSLRRNLGPKYILTSRVKDVRSILSKLMRKPGKNYEGINDKAGVRVTVRFENEIESVCSVIRSLFDVRNEEDKKSLLGEDKVGYLGRHLDIALRDCDDAPKQAIGLTAELQIRTLTQHAWAELSHEISYKSDAILGSELPRQINRLSGLLEIADCEFLRIRQAYLSMPGMEAYKILDLLESRFFRYSPTPYDKDLSIQVINQLANMYGDGWPNQLTSELEEFCSEQKDRLKQVFEENSFEEAPLFLFQPEVLMIFMMLETKKLALRSVWRKTLPEEELLDIATKWGDPYC